ncbi:MAG: hypothetical protein QXS42_01030 [Zestosphaera sp.]
MRSSLRVATVFYSKTGRTRRAVELLSQTLRERGVSVDSFAVSPAREYFSGFLHANPRILYETLANVIVEICGVENFDPTRYDSVVIATPIWWGRPPPPITAFIVKYSNVIRARTYCITTADLGVDYSSRLRGLLSKWGYDVVGCVSLRDPEAEVGKLGELANAIVSHTRPDVQGAVLS